MAVGQAQKIDCGVRVRESGVGAGLPGAAAVMRFGPDQVAIFTRLVIAAPPAIANKMVISKCSHGRLQVAEARTDTRAFAPAPGLDVVTQEQGGGVGTD